MLLGVTRAVIRSIGFPLRFPSCELCVLPGYVSRSCEAGQQTGDAVSNGERDQDGVSHPGDPVLGRGQNNQTESTLDQRGRGA